MFKKKSSFLIKDLISTTTFTLTTTTSTSLTTTLSQLPMITEPKNHFVHLNAKHHDKLTKTKPLVTDWNKNSKFFISKFGEPSEGEVILQKDILDLSVKKRQDTEFPEEDKRLWKFSNTERQKVLENQEERQIFLKHREQNDQLFPEDEEQDKPRFIGGQEREQRFVDAEDLGGHHQPTDVTHHDNNSNPLISPFQLPPSFFLDCTLQSNIFHNHNRNHPYTPFPSPLTSPLPSSQITSPTYVSTSQPITCSSPTSSTPESPIFGPRNIFTFPLVSISSSQPFASLSSGNVNVLQSIHDNESLLRRHSDELKQQYCNFLTTQHSHLFSTLPLQEYHVTSQKSSSRNDLTSAGSASHQYPFTQSPTNRQRNITDEIPLPEMIRPRSSSLPDTSTKKSRRSRTVFTEAQLYGLERRFDTQKYLSTPDRVDLAKTLGLSQLQVKTWYQNRRMKWKKQVPPEDEVRLVSDANLLTRFVGRKIQMGRTPSLPHLILIVAEARQSVMQEGCKEPPTKPKGRPKKNSVPSYAELQRLRELDNEHRSEEEEEFEGVQPPPNTEVTA